MTECSVIGCNKVANRASAGLCEAHYARKRRYGSPTGRPAARPITECHFPGCDRRRATTVAGQPVCSMHAKRWKANGTFETTKKMFLPQAQKRQCSVPGCEQLEDGWCGMCKRHDSRRRRGAELDGFVLPRDRALPRGSRHHAWSSDPSYHAVHQRIRYQRGSASNYVCRCGSAAAQWAYLHTGVAERRQTINRTETYYSTDVQQYEAMCVSCHKRFDLARIRGSAA